MSTATHDIIVIGTSGGGIEVLANLVRSLPAGLPASIFIVCHYPADKPSVLPMILSRRGYLLATHPRDGEPIHPGHIYVAPPDYHMLVEESTIRLDHGPRENGLRPAIDPLFRSAARTFGPRVIGVILSGSSADGVAGLMAVRGSSGVAVVQDPRDAGMPALPAKAESLAGADYTVKAANLPGLLMRLVHEQACDVSRPRQAVDVAGRGRTSAAGAQTVETGTGRISALADFAAQTHNEREGKISTFTCPQCGGMLRQVEDGGLLRFRCHLGHAFEGDGLLEEQRNSLEAALWTSVRTFRERSLLARQLANRHHNEGREDFAERYDDEATVAERYCNVIQRYLLGVDPSRSSEDPS